MFTTSTEETGDCQVDIIIYLFIINLIYFILFYTGISTVTLHQIVPILSKTSDYKRDTADGLSNIAQTALRISSRDLLLLASVGNEFHRTASRKLSEHLPAFFVVPRHYYVLVQSPKSYMR